MDVMPFLMWLEHNSIYTVLIALTDNSPYWAGRDTGYASWRTMAWHRWPVAGPPPYFTSADHYDELLGSEFISYGRFARGGPLVSLDFVLDVVLEQRNPLDYQRVIDSQVELHLIASSIDQLKPVAFKKFTTKEEVKSALKASACIPLVAGPPAIRNGERFVDGVVLLSHPFAAAAADGCTHVLVIRTRSEDTSAGRITAGNPTSSSASSARAKASGESSMIGLFWPS